MHDQKDWCCQVKELSEAQKERVKAMSSPAQMDVQAWFGFAPINVAASFFSETIRYIYIYFCKCYSNCFLFVSISANRISTAGTQVLVCSTWPHHAKCREKGTRRIWHGTKTNTLSFLFCQLWSLWRFTSLRHIRCIASKVVRGSWFG